ncbi:anti-sigma factor antagonist [Actinomadura sp. KC216]|uniref:STAS domain-containing protein n=1 Tax=Actinomadura sp. KC216 TaxID=2530370 RepID=UPI00104512BA|nr:STAS domain-containing protein [Actinomadura sp. KC216]TDB89512.1 anti-sigma factor antagonist [Actinomadura sp. KC216]
MALIVESRFHPDHMDLAIVTLNGELDVATAPQLRERLAAVLGEGADHLVLDFARLSFIDSSGLSVLTAAHRLVHGTGDGHPGSQPNRTLVLAAVIPRIRETLRTTGLTRVLPIYSTADLAITVHQASHTRP